MKLEIFARKMDLTDGLRGHVTRRIAFALGRLSSRIDVVHVRLADLNGPRGGVDKTCDIQVQLGGLPAVRVEQVDADMYAAIDRAADRVGRTVARRLDRALAFSGRRRRPLARQGVA